MKPHRGGSGARSSEQTTLNEQFRRWLADYAQTRESWKLKRQRD